MSGPDLRVVAAVSRIVRHSLLKTARVQGLLATLRKEAQECVRE